MAKSKKNEKSGPAPGGRPRQPPGIKVTREFHKKLKQIAADVEKELGQLVMDQMEDFVNRETRRIAEKMRRESQGSDSE